MQNTPKQEHYIPNLVPPGQNSGNSTPMFVWSFFMNVPDSELRHQFNSNRENHQGSIVLTPNRRNEDKISAKSLTPHSVVDKLHDFSPFKTTCQKLFDNSPISPSLWKKINSSLKKTKQSTMTPLGSLFQHSSEKEGLFENRENFLTAPMEPSIFHNELLLFPDLDRNIYDSMQTDQISNNQLSMCMPRSTMR